MKSQIDSSVYVCVRVCEAQVKVTLALPDSSLQRDGASVLWQEASVKLNPKGSTALRC